MYIVYYHRNIITNKYYVGITKQKTSARFSNGKKYTAKKFKNAIDKYGWENFEHKEIVRAKTKEDALELESYYIKKYNSVDEGYNTASFGDISSIGYQHTSEYKEELRRRAKENYEKNLAGKQPKWSEERKERFKEKMRPRWDAMKRSNGIIKKPKRKKIVLQLNYETLEVINKFNTTVEASNQVGISRSKISEAAQGKRKSAAGYKWKYDYANDTRNGKVDK